MHSIEHIQLNPPGTGTVTENRASCKTIWCLLSYPFEELHYMKLCHSKAYSHRYYQESVILISFSVFRFNFESLIVVSKPIFAPPELILGLPPPPLSPRKLHTKNAGRDIKLSNFQYSFCQISIPTSHGLSSLLLLPSLALLASSPRDAKYRSTSLSKWWSSSSHPHLRRLTSFSSSCPAVRPSAMPDVSDVQLVAHSLFSHSRRFPNRLLGILSTPDLSICHADAVFV